MHTEDRRKKNTFCDATGAEKKVPKEGSAIFHFVHSDMMKYVITYCGKRVLSHRVILEAAMLKVSIDA